MTPIEDDALVQQPGHLLVVVVLTSRPAGIEPMVLRLSHVFLREPLDLCTTSTVL